MATIEKHILILCKTYPSPSARYVETSCVAGMDERGTLIRLYPVPFRMINDARQFKKYQWIHARIKKTKDDKRPESHRIFVDTIELDGPPLPTDEQWQQRRLWLDKLKVFEDFQSLEDARKESGVSLAVLRPSSKPELQITPVSSPEWTSEEKEKLLQLQKQPQLSLDPAEAQELNLLKKLPFEFHYSYRSGEMDMRHKIVDWEAGALYWNVSRRHNAEWERPFRNQLGERIPGTDLHFLMGTIHRFPDQWLIVSLLYPPRRRSAGGQQGSLF
ncbi:MAG: hypothetical protein ACYDC3_00335 [Candidatus Binataceae bacterium]